MTRILFAAALAVLFAAPAHAAPLSDYEQGYCDGYRKAVNEAHGAWVRWDALVNIMNAGPPPARSDAGTPLGVETPNAAHVRELVTALRNSVKHFIHKGDLPDSQPFAFRTATDVVICAAK